MSSETDSLARERWVAAWRTLSTSVEGRLAETTLQEGEWIIEAVEKLLGGWLSGSQSASKAASICAAAETHAQRAEFRRRQRNRRVLAVHEASHAVAGLLSGVPVVFVTVLPDASDRSAASVHFNADALDALDPESSAIVSLAGRAGQKLVEGEVGWWPNDDDKREAMQAVYCARPDLDQAQADHLFAFLFARAEGLLRRHWPAVAALAEALMEHEVIHGPEVKTIVATALQGAGLTPAAAIAA